MLEQRQTKVVVFCSSSISFSFVAVVNFVLFSLFFSENEERYTGIKYPFKSKSSFSARGIDFEFVK